MSKGGLVEFKPARRVFAGRGRSMLTFGEWKIAIFGILFGGAVGAGWFYELPEERVLAAPAGALAGDAPAPRPAAAPELARAVEAVADEETSAEEASVLPQIVLAQDDGRRARAAGEDAYGGRVSRVVDGDTFYLEGLSTRIRLWGVDAPEREELGFDEATETLAALVAGQTLSCEHIDTDRYLRIVARCYFADGRDLSEAMIESGAAAEYLRFTQGYYSGE